MAIKGTFQFPELAAKPSAPPVGSIILYVKTDNVLYIQDSTGTEFAFGSVNFISQLIGDVSAVGPGVATATVNSVGGSSAANIHAAELLANAATPLNTANQIIKRDGSGNYAANVGTLAALKLLGSVTGTLTLAAPATFSDWTMTLPTTAGTVGQALITNGTGQTSWASVLMTSLNDGKIWVGDGSNLAQQRTPSGDVSMSDLGVFTVNSVGGSSAANIHAAELLANAATSANTANAIVRRDGSGNISVSALSASSGSFIGISDIVQALVKGFAGQGSDIFQVQKSDGTVFFKVDPSGNAVILGTLTASNFSGSSSGANTGDVTITAFGTTPDAKGASISGQAITLQPADGTHPGLVSILAQSFAGIKTFLAQLLVSDTTQSTTSGTGSIVTQGGLGVAKNINAGGTIAASNFSGSSSGTNTGDVTKTDTDSIQLVLAAQNLSANLKLSSDPADAGNLKMTATIHSGAGAGLHIEAPFGVPVNIGTSNATGSDTALALRDHVHAITWAVIAGLVISTYTVGANAALAVTDTLVQALGKLQGQINAIVGSAITSLTGDVVASGPGAAASTIQPNVVTNAKLAQMPANTIKGNNTGSTANALDLTVAQVNTLLGDVTTVGTFDGQVAAANGAVISGNSIFFQSASGTRPGMVNTGTQTFAGNKTFSGVVQVTPPSDSKILGLQQFAASPASSSDYLTLYNSTGSVLALIDYLANFLSGDGNAPQPAHGFRNQAGVGMYRQGSNILALATAASERMRIDATGLVGIGQTSPNERLDVGNGNIRISNNGKLRLTDNQGSPNVIGVSAPATVSASYDIKLPTAQGAAGTVPFNDGSGNLSWANPVLNIDGGRPDSVYTASQFINGGTP